MVGLVVVFADGPEPPGAVEIAPGAMVIAADGGAAVARMCGVEVDLIVGDFDSFVEEPARGVGVERHLAEKDATDLELALAAALSHRPERILVVGGAGGRLDHLLGGLLLLASEAYEGVRVDAQFGAAAVHVIRNARTLYGEPDELISLFAVHGPAHGVVTEGLAYVLRGETLEPGSTRGVSNMFAAREARVGLESGVLLAVRPSGSATAGD